MRIDVRLFAVIRERAGVDRIDLDLPEHATVEQARIIIAEKYPSVSTLMARTASAVNRNYATLETELHDGDELALIPPVSGG